MRLYDEIFKDADGGAFARCTIVPSGGGYFQGVKGVGDFSSERIVVYFPKQTIEAEGKSLSIKKYYDGDLQISGNIFSLKVLQEDASLKQPKKDGEV